jgi:hypothetical protein
VVTVYYGTFGYAGGIVLGLKALLAAVAGGIGRCPAHFSAASAGFQRVPVVRAVPHRVPRSRRLLLLVALLVLRPNGLFGLRELLPPKVQGQKVCGRHEPKGPCARAAHALASRGSFFSTTRA